MSEIELKPCPFCRSEAAMVKQRKSGKTRDIVNAFVRCKSCGARSKNVSSLHVAERNLEAYAAKSWNRRRCEQEERLCSGAAWQAGESLGYSRFDGEPLEMCKVCEKSSAYEGGRG